jgi:hypothetical protein
MDFVKFRITYCTVVECWTKTLSAVEKAWRFSNKSSTFSNLTVSFLEQPSLFSKKADDITKSFKIRTHHRILLIDIQKNTGWGQENSSTLRTWQIFTRADLNNVRTFEKVAQRSPHEIVNRRWVRSRDMPITLLAKFTSTKIHFICNLLQIWKNPLEKRRALYFSNPLRWVGIFERSVGINMVSVWLKLLTMQTDRWLLSKYVDYLLNLLLPFRVSLRVL